jgi:hypothetical protein
MYGRFELDMNSRLELAPKPALPGQRRAQDERVRTDNG